LNRFTFPWFALALCACATESARGPSELSLLKEQMAAMRVEQARVAGRLSRLEQGQALRTDAAPAASGGPSMSGGSAVPALTVVKLKPRSQPAPKLDTRVRVQEPNPEDLPEPKEVADPEVLEAEYQSDLSALRSGDVEGASHKLEIFANSHPRNVYADNALYFSGVGYMGLSEYAEAAKRFERVRHEYPAGDALPDALLKLGECRARLNQKDEAQKLYVQVTEKYPGTAAATQAQERLGMLERN
jgi:tol-pal system protein YbgF